MASQFSGKTFTFTQPDGTKFEVRGWGDQHYAVFETLDGYTVVKNPSTGFWEIAKVSDDGTMLESAPGPSGNLDGASVDIQPGLRISRDAARVEGMQGVLRMGGRRCDQRREQNKNMARAALAMEGPLMAPPRRETVGDFVGLCLLIEFPDEPGTIQQGEVERFCNEQGYSGFGNNGSVFDYFNENSIGRCRYTNIVTEYYTAKHAKSYYTDPDIRQGIRARQLIREALTHLKANNFDFQRLTVDSNGMVYAMNIYYAGEVENNWAEGLWPHAWHMGTPIELAPGISAFDYQFTNMGHELTLGTFCHENGHMLCDYPDLYDYGSESGGVGAFCLMCAGGNISKKNPTHISAYLKRLSGWANSIEQIQHDKQITLPSGGNDFAIFAKNNGEYFIIENRRKSERDIALPDEGLAIWHVDEAKGDNSNEQMTPGQHYELSLEQADGKFDLERSRTYGDHTDLFGQTNKRFGDSTVPSSKWWDGTSSNLEIFDISSPGAAISFKSQLHKISGGLLTVKGESAPDLNIPDNLAQGITDTIAIGPDGIIASVKVTLDISHTYIGDLRVTLLTPWGDAVVLHQRYQGGSNNNIKRTLNESDLLSLANLQGHRTKGDWKLLIQDFAPVDVGILNNWALEFSTLTQPQLPVVLEEAPGIHIPDNKANGIQRTLTTNSSGKVGSVEVSVDITHPWISDLKITIHSPTGSQVILHDNTGGSNDDVIKTYTALTTEKLGDFSGQSIKGDWKLHISDEVGQDVGKLNSWRVVIHPAF